jgi:hypothetical protein
MLVSLPNESPSFVDALKLGTKQTSAADAYTFAATAYLSLQDLVVLQSAHIAELNATLAVALGFLDGEQVTQTSSRDRATGL